MKILLSRRFWSMFALAAAVGVATVAVAQNGRSGLGLPTWYDQHRVQAHTRLTLRTIRNNPNHFFNGGDGFAKMGVEVYTRSIKSGREGAWWPSAVGAVAPEAKTQNLAQRVIDDAKKHGARLIAYHRHMEDEEMARRHPDWRVLDVEGQPARAGRGIYMCFNSPYVEFYEQRSIELLKMGVDGFYFDEDHLPPAGCFCDNCKRKFKEETGKDAPTAVAIRDPLYQEYIDFQNRTMARTFKRWNDAFKKVNPNMVMIVSAHRWNSFGNRHLSSETLRFVDGVKTEFNVGLRRGNNLTILRAAGFAPVEPEPRMVLAWIMARDVADGRPAHIWVPGLTETRQAMAAASALLATGNIANIDVEEANIPDMRLKPAFDLGDRISRTLSGARPLRWAGILYSERARDKRSTNEIIQWREVYYPVYGAFRTAFLNRIPVGIVFDHQLEAGALSGIRVLFVPNPEDLSDNQKVQLEAFKSRGGRVIEGSKDQRWFSPETQTDVFNAFRDDLRSAGSPPASVVGGPADLITGYFTKGSQFLVTLANDASWVKVLGDTQPVGEPGAAVNNVRIRYRGPQPQRVREAVSGRVLRARPVRGGEFEITVPTFDNLAVIAIDQ
jgi:hypothetical protein